VHRGCYVSCDGIFLTSLDDGQDCRDSSGQRDLSVKIQIITIKIWIARCGKKALPFIHTTAEQQEDT